MTVEALLVELRDRGVQLVPEGDRLRVRPASAVPPDLLGRLREHKAEVLALLTGRPSVRPARHVAEALPFLRMPLDVFARAGASLEVRVPWLDVTMWMVPTGRDAVQLMAEGVQRGRIWTAAELMQFMAIADRTPETVRTLTHAKLGMDGEITEVRTRGNGRRALAQDGDEEHRRESSE